MEDGKLSDNLNVVEIRQAYKKKLIARINKGEIGLLPELEALERLEKGELPGTGDQGPGTGKGQNQNPNPESPNEEYGIPERLLIKRKPYTMTDEAKTQRKNAAKSGKKSASMKGNKNAHKHGRYAQGFIRQIFRPCLSTCDKYPCSIVQDGDVEPGEICTDKVQFVHTLQAIEEAMKNPKSTTFREMASLQIAGSMEVVKNIIMDILQYGTLVKSENYNGFGQVIGYDIKANPALPFLAKLIDSLNLSPQDFLLTPMMIKKMKTEDKKAKTLADIMSGLGGGAKEESEETED